MIFPWIIDCICTRRQESRNLCYFPTSPVMCEPNGSSTQQHRSRELGSPSVASDMRTTLPKSGDITEVSANLGLRKVQLQVRPADRRIEVRVSFRLEGAEFTEALLQVRLPAQTPHHQRRSCAPDSSATSAAFRTCCGLLCTRRRFNLGYQARSRSARPASIRMSATICGLAPWCPMGSQIRGVGPTKFEMLFAGTVALRRGTPQH